MNLIGYVCYNAVTWTCRARASASWRGCNGNGEVIRSCGKGSDEVTRRTGAASRWNTGGGS